MARIRSIKPDFFTSPDIAALSIPARMTFVGLWTYCDDSGRGYDDPRLVKAAVWPLDDDRTITDVAADLKELTKRGQIRRYRVDGRAYLQVCNWQHQKISHPTPSKLPPPPEKPPEKIRSAPESLSPDLDLEVEQGKDLDLEQGAGTRARDPEPQPGVSHENPSPEPEPVTPSANGVPANGDWKAALGVVHDPDDPLAESRAKARAMSRGGEPTAIGAALGSGRVNEEGTT